MYKKNIGQLAKKFFLLIFCLFFLTDISFANDAQIIKKIEKYMNTENNIIAKFKQVTSHDNKEKTGVVYILKPGNLRFEYLEPKKTIIVLNKDIVMHYDYELDETSYLKEDNYFFKMFSSNNINLQKDVKKVEVYKGGVKLYITKHHNNINTEIMMNFSMYPITLKEIYFKNESQDAYNVYFEDIKYNQKISSKLFSVQSPKFFSSPY
jgi:outer membrane lipoprotein-sorting protein